jgi:hypothetical protein
MSNALAYLIELVEDGMEYPDAEFKAARKFQVPADELRDDYDRLMGARLGLRAQFM